MWNYDDHVPIGIIVIVLLSPIAKLTALARTATASTTLICVYACLPRPDTLFPGHADINASLTLISQAVAHVRHN